MYRVGLVILHHGLGDSRHGRPADNYHAVDSTFSMAVPVSICTCLSPGTGSVLYEKIMLKKESGGSV